MTNLPVTVTPEEQPIGVFEPGTVGHFLGAAARRLPLAIANRVVSSWQSRDLRDGFTLTVRWKDEPRG